MKKYIIICLVFISNHLSANPLIEGKWINVSIKDLDDSLIYYFKKDSDLYLFYKDNTIAKKEWEFLDSALIIENDQGRFISFELSFVSKDSLVLTSKNSEDLILLPLEKFQLHGTSVEIVTNTLLDNYWNLILDSIVTNLLKDPVYFELFNNNRMISSFVDSSNSVERFIYQDWELINVESVFILSITASLNSLIFIDSVDNNIYGKYLYGSKLAHINFIDTNTNIDTDSIDKKLKGKWGALSNANHKTIEFAENFNSFYIENVDDLHFTQGVYHISKNGKWIYFDYMDGKELIGKILKLTKDNLTLELLDDGSIDGEVITLQKLVKR